MSVKRRGDGGSTAKLFMHGRSQAVRLPKEFRFEGNEVKVSREGNRVILEPTVRTAGAIASAFAEIDRLLDGDEFLLNSDDSSSDPPVPADPRSFYE